MTAITSRLESDTSAYDLLAIDSTANPLLDSAPATLLWFAEKGLSRTHGSLWETLSWMVGNRSSKMQRNIAFAAKLLAKHRDWAGRGDLGPTRLLAYLDMYVPLSSPTIYQALLDAGHPSSVLDYVAAARRLIQAAIDGAPGSQISPAYRKAEESRDPDLLTRLLNHWHYPVRAAAVGNPATPRAGVRLVLAGDSDVAAEVGSTLQDEEFFSVLLPLAPPRVWMSLMANPLMRGLVQEEFVRERCEAVRSGAYSDRPDLLDATRAVFDYLVSGRCEQPSDATLLQITGLPSGDQWQNIVDRARVLLRTRKHFD